MKLKSIKHYRRRINGIDRRIMKMLVMRYKSVDCIGKLKKKEGKEIVDNKREHDILQKIEKLNTGSKIKNYIVSIYKTVFSASYIIEKEE
jgi:chorismate mutase